MLIEDDLVKCKWQGIGPMFYKSNFHNVLIAYSKSKKIATAKQEWIENSSCKLNTKCICGESLQEVIFIRNKYNGNILKVGKRCLTNLYSVVPSRNALKVTRPRGVCSNNLIREETKLSIEDDKSSPIDTLAVEFQRYITLIKDPKGKKLIDDYFAEKELKKCQLCHILPTNKDFCSDCLLKLEPKNSFRSCISCKSLSVPDKNPSWKNLCDKCHRIKLRKRYPSFNEHYRLRNVIDRLSPPLD